MLTCYTLHYIIFNQDIILRLNRLLRSNQHRIFVSIILLSYERQLYVMQRLQQPSQKRSNVTEFRQTKQEFGKVNPGLFIA